MKNTFCVLEFNETQWKYKSKTSRDLVNKFLQADPAKRITAVQALNHPWFKQGGDLDGQGVDGAWFARAPPPEVRQENLPVEEPILPKETTFRKRQKTPIVSKTDFTVERG